ncbi:hypothetical protein BB558_000058 [Smittium angustum]|uniref:FAM86 N-terminal domain-containing protein n=1 Tax=Smittium angustum TaxID=133377 RepID=A0A2U1JFB5_SMIAN|nr:hypothetical protein BB558_000058 [Smittium angustum]
MGLLLQTPPNVFHKGTDIKSIENTLFYIEIQLQRTRGISEKNGFDQEISYYPWNLTEKIEKEWCVKWIETVIKWSTKKLENDLEKLEYELFSQIVTLASNLLSELCGKAASNSNQVCIRMWDQNTDPIDIKIQEPSFGEADVGSKTWGSSVLLSRWVSRNSIDLSIYNNILELGSGTGLSSMAICRSISAPVNDKERKCFTITDYIPVLLESIKKSIDLNFSQQAIYKSTWSLNLFSKLDVYLKRFDWFAVNSFDSQSRVFSEIGAEHVEPPRANYFDVTYRTEGISSSHPELLELENTQHSFDLIVAADVLYEIEHAKIIPQVVDCLLLKRKKQPEAVNHGDISEQINLQSSNNNITCSQNVPESYYPMFILVAPLRKTHWSEINTFESEMDKFGFSCIFSKDVTLSEDLEDWCTKLNKPLENLLETLPGNVDSESDNELYRIYYWKRK